jgi:hypothetical protein
MFSLRKFAFVMVAAMAAGLALNVSLIRAEDVEARAAAAERSLSAANIRSTAWDKTPLTEVCRDIARAANVSIVLDSKNVDGKATLVTLDVSNLSASNVLALVMQVTGLRQDFRNGVVWITTEQAAKAKPVLTVKTYDVRDLTAPIQDFPAPDIDLGSRSAHTGSTSSSSDSNKPPSTDDLVDLIQAQIEPDAWDNNGCKIKTWRGTLIVTATREMHKKIRELLAKL